MPVEKPPPDPSQRFLGPCGPAPTPADAMETTPLTYPSSPLYTRAQYDAVARHYLDGDSHAEAAEKAGVHPRAAHRFLKRNGLSRTPNATRYGGIVQEAKAAATMARVGSRVEHIADFLGVSRRTAYRRLALAAP